MTREEAIRWLKAINTKEFGWDEFALQESQREIRERCEQGVREAIDMAIEALSADAVSDAYKRGFEDCKRAYEIELARSADRELANLKSEFESADTVHGEWMPCSERLPIPPMFCLVTTDGSHGDVIDIALYMSDGWHKASEVLAWMPLPTPYKGGDDE